MKRESGTHNHCTYLLVGCTFCLQLLDCLCVPPHCLQQCLLLDCPNLGDVPTEREREIKERCKDDGAVEQKRVRACGHTATKDKGKKGTQPRANEWNKQIRKEKVIELVYFPCPWFLFVPFGVLTHERHGARVRVLVRGGWVFI